MKSKLIQWCFGLLHAAWGGAFAPLTVAFAAPGLHLTKDGMEALWVIALGGALGQVFAYCQRSPIPGLCDDPHNPQKKWFFGLLHAAWGGLFVPLAATYSLPSSFHFTREGLIEIWLVGLTGAIAQVLAYCQKSPLPNLCTPSNNEEPTSNS